MSIVVMETSRDRVLNAINHIQPEVTPVHLMGIDDIDKWLDYFDARDYVDLRDKLDLDLQEARPVYLGENAKQGLNIWGAEAASGGSSGSGYSKARSGFPLANAADVTDVEKHRWPSPDEFDYDIVAEVLRSIPSDKARFVKVQYSIQKEAQSREHAARSGGTWIPLLCTMFDLFAIEDTLINLYTQPDMMEAVVRHVEEFTLEYTRRLLESTRGLVDVLWYGDDFASQKEMMISPDMWRKYLKPTYIKIFSLAKDYGLKVWFHSCGTFRPVLSDLVEIGMDVWETTQVHLPGNEPDVLKREYGRDITFFGAISTQHTLPFGTPEDVRTEVRERIRVLGAGGGYICGADHTIMPEVPIENVLAMLDEARTYRP